MGVCLTTSKVKGNKRSLNSWRLRDWFGPVLSLSSTAHTLVSMFHVPPTYHTCSYLCTFTPAVPSAWNTFPCYHQNSLNQLLQVCSNDSPWPPQLVVSALSHGPEPRFLALFFPQHMSLSGILYNLFIYYVHLCICLLCCYYCTE